MHEAMPYLKVAHGAFNTLVMLLFFWQASRGLRIRRARLGGGPPPEALIRRHRHRGPRLVCLAVAGFFAGLTLVVLGWKELVWYPLHFYLGLTLVFSICCLYGVSRLIRGQRYRRLHLALGLWVLALYVAQALAGLDILV